MIKRGWGEYQDETGKNSINRFNSKITASRKARVIFHGS